MASVATRGDSVRTYLTGAGSDGGAQTDPNAALGNYRSSTEVVSLSATAPVNITGVTVDYVSGKNGEGSGTLTFTSSGQTLQWTPPGGSIGTAVSIGSDGSYLIEGASDACKSLRVTVVAASLPGSNQTDSITLAREYNKQFDNVSSSEATAGDTEYRALMIRNVNAAAISDLAVYIYDRGISDTATSDTYAASGAVTVTVNSTTGYPDSGFITNETSAEKMYYTSKTATTFVVPAAGRAQFGTSAAAGNSADVIAYCPPFQIALEAPSSNHLQTIANESTAPTAVSFSQPTDSASALSIGALAASTNYGIWLKRPVVAGSSSITSLIRDLRYSFGAP